MKACLQCGLCCKEEVCTIGYMLFNNPDIPCPGLIFENNKYWCGSVLNGDNILKGISTVFSEALGIGKGCDTVQVEKEVICL